MTTRKSPRNAQDLVEMWKKANTKKQKQTEMKPTSYQRQETYAIQTYEATVGKQIKLVTVSDSTNRFSYAI